MTDAKRLLHKKAEGKQLNAEVTDELLEFFEHVVTDFDMIVGGLWITFQEALYGYLLAISVGISSAAVMSQSKILERSFYPYAILLQTLPAVAVAPLAFVLLV